MERTKHISSSFDSALYGLRNDVLMMSSLTDRMFQTAFEALLKRDTELCNHVIAEDEEIDHASNIAEDSFWRDQADDIRHTYGPKKES
jgi:phosphate uptake regulator